MHAQTHYPVPGVQQPREPAGRRKQTLLNVLSLLIALYAVNEVLGLSNAFALHGMTNDDVEIAMESTGWKLLFDPVGTALLIALLVSVFAIHRKSKKMPWFSNRMTKVGLVTTATAFVLSLFRVSVIFPVVFTSVGLASNQLQNGSDVRVPAAEEFVFEPVQVIHYSDAGGVRLATAFTNNSKDHWQSATVAITYSDAAGTKCGGHQQTEDYIAPGQQRAITTKFLSAVGHYRDPLCVPVVATAELASIDLDSRTEISPADYERAVPVFDSLVPLEEPSADGSITLSVTGTVAADSRGALQAGSLPVGFEMADQNGLRFNWCFALGDVASDGSFTTPTLHSIVDPGDSLSVMVIPAGC